MKLPTTLPTDASKLFDGPFWLAPRRVRPQGRIRVAKKDTTMLLFIGFSGFVVHAPFIRALEQLKTDGLINEEEYNGKRKEILGEL